MEKVVYFKLVIVEKKKIKFFFNQQTVIRFRCNLLIIQNYICQKQLNNQNKHSSQKVNKRMQLQHLDHSFSTEQQTKILQEIQSINKKLFNYSYSNKPNTNSSKSNNQSNKSIPYSKNSQKIFQTNKIKDDKYFSQQCEQLFKDQLHSQKQQNTQKSYCQQNIIPKVFKKQKNKISHEESLFNSQNDLLLDSQYQKQIKNFKQFQTNQYPSLKKEQFKCHNFQSKPLRSNSNFYFNSNNQEKKLNKISYPQNSNVSSQNTKLHEKNIKQQESKVLKRYNSLTKVNASNKQNITPNNQPQINSHIQQKNSNLTTKTTKQQKQMPKDSSRSKNKSYIKKLAESKIKKYIQNKQNIFPFSNNTSTQNQKKKSILKEYQNKFRCDKKLTQKIQQNVQLANENRPDDDSLELFENCQSSNQDTNLAYFWDKNIKGASNPKLPMKYDSYKDKLQCTFKPNILKKSEEIAQNLQPSFQRLTQDIYGSKSQSKLPYRAKQQLSTKKYSYKRLEQLSQPRRLKTTNQDQQQKQCFFKPILSKKSLQHMANCTLDVASRNKLWLQQKEAKINRLKTEQQQNKLKRQMGSYAPKINKYKGQSQVHLSRFAKQGMTSYFQRVSMANKQKNSTSQLNKSQNLSKQVAQTAPVNIKKKTYEQAVKDLHNKIMNMNL